MSTQAIGSSKSLTGKTIGIAAGAAIIVLGIIGWTAGWFGGSEPQQAAPAPTATEQPAAPANSTAPAAPAPATATQGSTTP